MKSSGTSEFWQLYRELPEPIRQSARRSYRLGDENPRAPALRFKKVRDVYSVRIVFFFQAEDGIRDLTVTGVQTCALPISARRFILAVVAVRLEPVLHVGQA